jgi:SAM-dependent methyltransferase
MEIMGHSGRQEQVVSSGSRRENQRSWNWAIGRHNECKGDFTAAIRQGNRILPDDVDELFPRSPGTRLLHPLCNDGREACYLGFSRGYEVTGIDFSSKAIRFARTTARGLGIRANFLTAEAASWLSRCPDQSFDVALTTLGTLWWFDDLYGVVSSLHRVLKPGGKYVLWDFHPLVGCIDDNMRIYRSYPIERVTLKHPEGVHDYISNPDAFSLLNRKVKSDDYSSALNPWPVTDFRWGLGVILDALIHARFKLLKVAELPYLWEERYFAWLTECGNRRFMASHDTPTLPLSILIVVSRA